NELGTAQRLLIDVWNLQTLPEAARLLAKLNLEKLDDPRAAEDWLSKLGKMGDARARVELSLLGLAVDESKDSDVRAAEDAGPPVVVTRSSVGNHLATLAEHPETEREALLACIFHDMIDAGKSPSCLRSRFTSLLLSWLRPGSTVNEKIDALRKSGDPWV